MDLDLENFFDQVNHDMARAARKVTDKRVLTLIRAYLNAGAMVDGKLECSQDGTPQGGPLSPLLANILLDDLDKELTGRGMRFVRYADDCNIFVFVASKRAGERVMESVSRYLEGKLKLKVNREKSAVARPWHRKFLGFSFLSQKQAGILIAPKSLQACKERIRELTNRTCSHLNGRTNQPIRSISDGLAWLLPSRHGEDTPPETGSVDSEKTPNVFVEAMETSAYTNP